MATIEQRTYITLDGESLERIKQLAKKSKTSISKICAKFVTKQLEEDEDAYWMSIIEKRKNEDTISHEKMLSMINDLPN